MPFLPSVFVHRKSTAVQNFNILLDQDKPIFLIIPAMKSWIVKG